MATANDLRRFAEAADSTRDEELFFVVKNNELVPAKERPASGDYLIVRTDSRGRGLRAGPDVALSVSGTRGIIPSTADAAFTTQSAFEKFVLPYYIRSRSPQELIDSFRKVYEEDVVCVYHELTSETLTIPKMTPAGEFHALYRDGTDMFI